MRDAHIWSQRRKKCSRSRCARHRTYTSVELTKFCNVVSFSLVSSGKESSWTRKENRSDQDRLVVVVLFLLPWLWAIRRNPTHCQWTNSVQLIGPRKPILIVIMEHPPSTIEYEVNSVQCAYAWAERHFEILPFDDREKKSTVNLWSEIPSIKEKKWLQCN